MLTWQRNVKEQKLSYDGIMLYSDNQSGLNKLGHALCATSTVIDRNSIQEYKVSYLEYFEMLNMLLLRYIPGKPEAKWCTLLSLLADYGVDFPSHLHDPIAKHVLFPDDTKTLESGALHTPIPHNTTGQFNPGHEISLRISRDLSLKAICKLVQDLEKFLRHFLDRIDMMVFFRLHYSEMFDKYLKLFLKKETSEQLSEMNPAPAMSAIHSSISKLPSYSVKMVESEAEEGLPLSVFLKSLDNTKQLLVKLMEGKATYNEIIAEGTLNLSALDIEGEFTILDEFTFYLNRP